MTLFQIDFRKFLSVALLTAAGALLVLMDYPDRGLTFVPAEDRPPETPSQRLSELMELTQAVGLLREHYAFQARLDPGKMLLAALRGVEEEFEYALVTPSSDLGPLPGEGTFELPETVGVQLRDAARRFDVSEIEDLYHMTWKLMEILERFPTDEETAKRLEDAAVEGMLSVLDPHTVYLDEHELREMKLSTRGSFGGLGIVISVREGKLKVISVMPKTPAARGGLKKWDHIVQIGAESTINMTVTEAANQMRGKPGTPITVWILRKGFDAPRAFDLEREEIKVESVLAKGLDGDTAYVKVKGFQQSTAREVEKFLDETYPDRPPAGVVLDLRGNSGGVMNAAVKLADLFVGSGNIVTTVEKPRKGTETDAATPGDRYEGAAVIVLVDHASASASEIVTAALKYTDRALVLGQRTFGKGSVQYINELARGALKMTVAQYVGPNMEAIQGIGIDPHVELRRVRTGSRVRLPSFADRFEGEGALPHHLEKTGAVPVYEPPVFALRYVPERKPIREGEEQEYDAVVIDEPVQLAWSMLSLHADPSAGRMLDASFEFLDEMAQLEDEKLAGLAEEEGKRWAPGAVPLEPDLDVAVTFDSDRVVAGIEGRITVRVTNRSAVEVPKLYARTESTNYKLDGKSCLIGNLARGETSSCEMGYRVAYTSPDRTDRLFVDLLTGMDEPVASTSVVVKTDSALQPRLAFSYGIAEVEGNGDGLVQKGETFKLDLLLRNVGKGALEKGLAIAKNLSGASLFLSKGRVDITELPAGGTAAVEFALKAQEDPDDGAWRFELGVVDLSARTHFSSTQAIPAGTVGQKASDVASTVRAGDGAYLHPGPDSRLPDFGSLEKGGVYQATGKMGDWYRLQLTGSRWGWVRSDAVDDAVPRDEFGGIRETFIAVEPHITFIRRTPDELMGDAQRLEIVGDVDFGEGHAPLECGVGIYNNGEKVDMMYAGSRARGQHMVPFHFTIKLEEGQNRIVVEAYQKNQSPVYRSMYYNRVALVQ